MRVLVVDDHIDSVTSMGRLLSAFGYQVRTALDGLAALRCAFEFRPEAAIVDLSIPLLDGFQVARRIRAADETRRMLLIAMTGWNADDVCERARAAGFDVHLVKPLSIDALTGALSTSRC